MSIRKIKSFLLITIIIGMSIAYTVLIVYADTNGNELRITNQPDKLVLQLGDDWAGTEFELKLDSGIFPVPVKANSSGVVTMELGGSKTYTLTRLQPLLSVPVILPVPEDITQNGSDNSETGVDIETPTLETEETDITENEPAIETSELPDNSIPVLPLVIFLSGLIIAVGGLLIMRVMKKRREYHENDDDYEYDDE